MQVLTYQHASGKLGHRITNHSEETLNNVLNALSRAEQRLNAPVYFIEVYKIYKALYEDTIDGSGNEVLWLVKGSLLDLYRNDQILADKEMHRFSLMCQNQNTNKHITEFDLCSDRLMTKFRTYEFDQMCKIVPGPKTPRFNFEQLKEHLLSKDLSSDHAFNSNDFRFLDGSVDMTGNRVAF